MPGTVDDFMQKFGGSNTMSDQDASHYMDRFASQHPDDQAFDSNTMHQGVASVLWRGCLASARPTRSK